MCRIKFQSIIHSQMDFVLRTALFQVLAGVIVLSVTLIPKDARANALKDSVESGSATDVRLALEQGADSGRHARSGADVGACARTFPA